VLVFSNWNTVVNACFEDEVSVLTGLQAAIIIFILRSLSCLKHHQQRLNDMISVHVNCEIDNLLRKFSNDIHQNAVVESMHSRKLKSVHVFKLLIEVVWSLDDVKLRVDALQDALGQSLNQYLDNSGTMNIQRYLDYVVLDVSDEAFDGSWIGNLHDSLAQVVSKLIDHDI
jgi:hypothetical protein